MYVFLFHTSLTSVNSIFLSLAILFLKRLQAQATIGLNHRRYRNMADCAATMLREEGLASFYRGLAPTVLKSCAATGLTFAFYTFTKNVLESTHDSMVRQKGKREDKR